MWFQQDADTPHTSKDVLAWLKQKFGQRLISWKTENIWPPHSPDLSALDFFLWSYLKDRVYKCKPANVDKLKDSMRREF